MSSWFLVARRNLLRKLGLGWNLLGSTTRVMDDKRRVKASKIAFTTRKLELTTSFEALTTARYTVAKFYDTKSGLFTRS